MNIEQTANTEQPRDLEVGAASIFIELKKSTITVYHGKSDYVLALREQAPLGTWQALWGALEILGFKMPAESEARF